MKDSYNFSEVERLIIFYSLSRTLRECQESLEVFSKCGNVEMEIGERRNIFYIKSLIRRFNPNLSDSDLFGGDQV